MMSDKLCKRVISGSKQEEIKMQDVLGGLEEIATMLSYNPWPGDFEIIAIHPPTEEPYKARQEETVIKSQPSQDLPPKAKVICYQQRKNRLLKSA